MEALETMDEHRPIDLFEHLGADLDNEVRPDSHDALIEGSVVDLAHGDPVRDGRFSERMRVGKDVRSIKQGSVAEPADRTHLTVGGDHSLSEPGLVKASARQTRYVGSSGGDFNRFPVRVC